MFALFVAAAMATASPSPSPHPVSVAPGATFKISLPMTAGTGYGWQPKGPLPPGISLVSQSASQAPRPGGPQVQTFIFRDKAAGKRTLTMIYVRPWEKNLAPAQTRTFTIETKPAQ